MADTQRTLTAIMALLNANITGDIGDQDLRDAVETLHNGHGEISLVTPAETVITSSVSWFRDAGTYALNIGHHWTMDPANGQLQYIGEVDRMAHIAVSWSMTCAGNNKLLELVVARNGTPIEPSRIQRKVGTGSDVGTGAMHAACNVSPNDYLDVRIRNTTDTANVTLTTCNLFVMDMAIY